MLKKSDHIFILGDSPSLHKFDFNLLEGHDCVGMNLSYRQWHRINWYPRYYICLNRVMVETQAKEIANLIANRDRNKIELFFICKNILNYYPELSDNPSVIFFDDYLNSPYFYNIAHLVTTGSFATLFAAFLRYKLQFLFGVDQYMMQCIPEFEPDLIYRSWLAVKQKLDKNNIHVLNCDPISNFDLFDSFNISNLIGTHGVPIPSDSASDTYKIQTSPIADDKISNTLAKSTNPMDKIFLVSSYFSGKGQDRKIEFFERLDSCLQPAGYRLLLLNLGREQPNTTCETITCPRYITTNHQIHGRDFLKIEDLPPELIMSATVEAETRETSLVGAGLRLVLFNNFVKRILQERRPALCVLWHKFNGSHFALTHLCQELKIPHLYTEYGVLPGTISFDVGGQMAESWVAKKSKKFMDLPVDEKDFSRARNLLEYLKEKEKSGKPQDNIISITPFLKNAREKERKIIFYAGQNDWASGILPTPLPESNLHSPFYKDTIDALGHLSELAEENNWQILFKPHPLVQDRHKEYDVPYPDRIDLALGANILDCVKGADVVTTIVSQVSYISLIHSRPCVMLGRNQLRNKGCTGQPGKRSEVAQTFQAVLRDGFHGKAQKQWIKHISQICKYYLFAFDDKVESIIGRDVNEAADFLVQQVR